MEQQYYMASHYTNEFVAEQAYVKLSALLKQHINVELSAYRYKEPQHYAWVVIVVGDKPEEHIHKKLEQALNTGAPIEVNALALAFLVQRHKKAAKKAPWVEKRNQEVRVYLHHPRPKRRKH